VVPRWATVAPGWGRMSLVRSPSPFGVEEGGPN
jgi:hypothetical protein